MKKVFIGIVCILLTSCATNSKSRWALMGVAAPIGAGVGALTAPPLEKPEFHAFTWGAAFVTIAALIGNYCYNDDKELAVLRSEVKNLKNPKLELIEEGEGYSIDSFTQDQKQRIKWKMYKIDRWVSDGDDIKYHQDLMIKKEKKNEDK